MLVEVEVAKTDNYGKPIEDFECYLINTSHLIYLKPVDSEHPNHCFIKLIDEEYWKAIRGSYEENKRLLLDTQENELNELKAKLTKMQMIQK